MRKVITPAAQLAVIWSDSRPDWNSTWMVLAALDVSATYPALGVAAIRVMDVSMHCTRTVPPVIEVDRTDDGGAATVVVGPPVPGAGAVGCGPVSPGASADPLPSEPDPAAAPAAPVAPDAPAV